MNHLKLQMNGKVIEVYHLGVTISPRDIYNAFDSIRVNHLTKVELGYVIQMDKEDKSRYIAVLCKHYNTEIDQSWGCYEPRSVHTIRIFNDDEMLQYFSIIYRGELDLKDLIIINEDGRRKYVRR